MAQSKKNANPSRIIGMQFSILSPDEIRKASVANIVSRDTYINNKPVIGGLFDPRMGVLDPGLICPTDGLNYMQTPGYFGHIELARPIFYIQYLNTIVKILRCTCIKCSKLLIDKDKYKHLLKLPSKKRWDKIFRLANKVTRCGDETSDGCGCKQPRKITKDGLATLIAEWPDLSDGEGSEKLSMKLTPEMVIKIFRRISDEDVTFMGFSPVWSRPDWMVCQVLAVPPPAVRPSVKHDAQQRSEDDISHIIVNIIKANKTLQEKIQSNAPAKVIDDWTMVLQYYCATMIDNKIPGVASVAQRSGRPLKSIKERLVGKTGRVRGNLMGKRVDFSARSVITPDANIGISQLGIPTKVAKNITFPEKVNKRNKAFLTKLVRNGPDTYPGAKILEKNTGESISLKYVDKQSILLNYGDIVHRHLLDGDPVLFNRQPTLHRMSMMCHFAKILHKGDTFRLNVADTKPYNADFDGDEMNLHGPQDYESAAELANLAAVARHIISPANNSPIIGVFQDSLIGAYRLTRKDIRFDARTAMNLLMSFNKVNPTLFKKPTDSISSFELLSQILPPLSAHFANGGYDGKEDKKTTNSIIEIVNGRLVRGQLDKKALGAGSKGLLHSIFNDFGYEKAAEFIDNLQNIVTEYMKLSAYSVGISDLIADAETNSKISSAIITKKQEVKNLIDQTHLGSFENNTGKSNEVEFESKVNSILQKAADEAGKIGRKSLDADNRFVIMVNAGSKGKSLNIAQMVSCLGQQNVDGKRIPYGFEDRTLPHYTKYNDTPEARGFVESSFIQGLTPTELFFHAMGGRTGLIDTAVKTSTTGYIQRRLIKGMEDLKIAYDMTVRNNKNKIIQFAYGDDNIDTTKVENQNIDLPKMTREEIYAHFQMPGDDNTSAVITTNYTKTTIKRLAKQKNELKLKTAEMINYMIDSRNKLVEHVFKFTDSTNIHIPVHFKRIINNIHNQLRIQKNSLVNITPIEMYKMLDKKFKTLEQNHYAPPSQLFKIAFYYNLSPKVLLTLKRFNKKALILLLDTIVTTYKKAIIHPGEMAGMIAAQSIGEPTTQMTLNTFHFAGVASKSNATRGVPRVEEILSLSENPKKPSVTIHLNPNERENIEKAQELKYTLEYTCLRDVVETVSICFDPDNLTTLIEEDKPLMAEYNEFQQMIRDCMNDDFDDDEDDSAMSKWVVRLELDKEAMLDKHISMDDIHFAVSNSYKEDINCVYADMNADKLVFRIRLTKKNTKSKTKSLDQSDEIYTLKNFQNNLLDNIILRGVKKIPKVLLRKAVKEVVMEDTNYVQKDGWVLDTVGTNLRDILTLSTIDNTKTFSNDIQEVYRTLGIEAARQAIFNELSEAMDHAGVYINYHHMSLLCDRMAATCKMVSIFRHGINNDNIGPIAKASFEETPEMFLRAARHGELDTMTGVSSNIMCGQEGYFGTGSFQVILDMNKMKLLLEEVGAEINKTLQKDIDINAIMEGEGEDDICSKQNIQINNTVEYIDAKNTGNVDDTYDPGF